ncbi:MAG TPA: hypothetical protein VGM56_13650 [Byssovorax sp.]
MQSRCPAIETAERVVRPARRQRGGDGLDARVKRTRARLARARSPVRRHVVEPFDARVARQAIGARQAPLVRNVIRLRRRTRRQHCLDDHPGSVKMAGVQSRTRLGNGRPSQVRHDRRGDEARDQGRDGSLLAA